MATAEKNSKKIKDENGMKNEFTFKYDQNIFNNSNKNEPKKSFNLEDNNYLNSSLISEFMSLSLNKKIERYKQNSVYRKLKDKKSLNTFLHYLAMNDDNYPLLNLIKPTIQEMNTQNILRETPLHTAIKNKSEKISRYLIENTTNLNIVDNDFNTPLHLATINNDLYLVKILIKNNANSNMKNKKSETALDIAKKNNFKEIINYFNEILTLNFIKKESIDSIDENLKINKIKDNIKHNNYKFATISNTENNENSKNLYKGRFNNFVLNKPKIKKKYRGNSTSFVDYSADDKYSNDSKTLQVYMKKIVSRSRSNQQHPETKYETKTHDINNKKPEFIINNFLAERESSNENSILETPIKPKPRKTDIILNNEKMVDCDNESEEEEESIIRESTEGVKPKTNYISELHNLKTVKITSLSDLDNKKNPYKQVDNFINGIHKADISVSESDGVIYEDGLQVIEPCIDVSNINDNSQDNTGVSIDSFNNTNLKIKEEIKNKSKADLYNFLKKINMEKYNDLLISEGFDDINLIISQMNLGNPITDDALREIGISKAGDRAKILIRMQEVSHGFPFKIAFDSVYYNRNVSFSQLKFDFHVRALQVWLDKLHLKKFTENFYNNGYFSTELIFIQKASKFPINNTILERDIGITNANERQLVLNSISSNSKNYVSELLRKSYKKSQSDRITPSKNLIDEKCIIM